MSDKKDPANEAVDTKIKNTKKTPSKEQQDRMNRILEASLEKGMTPGELEDAVYREMFE